MCRRSLLPEPLPGVLGRCGALPETGGDPRKPSALSFPGDPPSLLLGRGVPDGSRVPRRDPRGPPALFRNGARGASGTDPGGHPDAFRPGGGGPLRPDRTEGDPACRPLRGDRQRHGAGSGDRDAPGPPSGALCRRPHPDPGGCRRAGPRYPALCRDRPFGLLSGNLSLRREGRHERGRGLRRELRGRRSPDPLRDLRPPGDRRLPGLSGAPPPSLPSGREGDRLPSGHPPCRSLHCQAL